MQLPRDVQRRLSDEFRFAAQNMANTDDFSAQIYYFTVFTSAANRAFNQTWSDELALLHLVVQSVHRELNTVVVAAASGQKLLGLPDELPGELTKACDKLAQVFESGQTEASTLYPLLARLAEIGYAVTGNGRYLNLRGEIKLSSDL